MFLILSFFLKIQIWKAFDLEGKKSSTITTIFCLMTWSILIFQDLIWKWNCWRDSHSVNKILFKFLQQSASNDSRFEFVDVYLEEDGVCSWDFMFSKFITFFFIWECMWFFIALSVLPSQCCDIWDHLCYKKINIYLLFLCAMRIVK